MNKKIPSRVLFVLLLAAFVLPALAHNAGFPAGYDPVNFIIDTPTDIVTTDPAWAATTDADSRELIQNVYETLLFYDRNYTLGPYSTGLNTVFVPKLATSWTFQTFSPPITDPDTGVIWNARFTCEIRTNVKFHNGIILTPEDVEYSFERLMVQDRAGGPASTIFTPLLNIAGAPTPTTDPSFGVKIDHSVGSDATHVWFNIADPTVTLAGFSGTLCDTVSSIVSKNWCIGLGDLDISSVPGGWGNWEYIYNMWHDPPTSFIEGNMMGTGPYIFNYWVVGVGRGVVKFDDYWDGWPARVSDDPNNPLYNQRLVSYVSRVTWTIFATWINRQSRFLAGDSDQPTTVPAVKATEDMLMGSPGIRCFYAGAGSTRHWERDWMRGWYYNPSYQGEYAYHIWKALTHFGDANNDGSVNVVDAAFISAHWTKPRPNSPLGPLGYNPGADLSGGTGGVVCGGTDIVVGIPDGRVDIVDAALVSAYWDGPPRGPAHP